MDPHTGAEIGDYRLDRKVGEGAFGAVWSGTHRETGDRVALKVLLPAAAASKEQLARFHREAELLARVRSPNVARLVEVVTDGRFGVCLVMELIDGELLSDLCKAMRLSVDDTIDLGVQLLDGVRDLHAVGIIHRDLKPNNVMLCSGADGSYASRRVVIFDLGLGRLLESAPARDPAARSITPSFVFLGTLECVAPEQILNAREVTERSDLYAVGTILYRAVMGRYPFAQGDVRGLAQQKLTEEAPPIEIDPDDHIAVCLRDIIAKAVARRPKDRYGSADEMQGELEELQSAMRDSRADTLAAAHAAKAGLATATGTPGRRRTLLAWTAFVLVSAGLLWRIWHR